VQAVWEAALQAGVAAQASTEAVVEVKEETMEAQVDEQVDDASPVKRPTGKRPRAKAAQAKWDAQMAAAEAAEAAEAAKAAAATTDAGTEVVMEEATSADAAAAAEGETDERETATEALAEPADGDAPAVEKATDGEAQAPKEEEKPKVRVVDVVSPLTFPQRKPFTTERYRRLVQIHMWVFKAIIGRVTAIACLLSVLSTIAHSSDVSLVFTLVPSFPAEKPLNDGCMHSPRRRRPASSCSRGAAKMASCAP
jgi:hypothetical protein